MIKAVLFDLDGTLVDSLSDLACATNRALAEYGFPERQTGEFKYFVGDGIPKMIERALPEGHKDSETVNKLRTYFLDYYSVHYADTTRAYDGMAALIERLRKNGFITAVVTNKAQEMADIVVGRLYGDVFDLVFGKREGVPGKPDPTLTLMAMAQLGVKPEECIFIGDSGMDVATGVNSGAVPVGELWGYRKEDELLANGARYIIRYPDELMSIIEGLNSHEA